MSEENKKALIENEYPSAPRPAVGVVVIDSEKRILMVRRGKPPAQGLWSVPGGSIELGETIFQCAKREVLEETGVTCRPIRVCNAIDAIYRNKNGDIRFHYVIVYIVAQYENGSPDASDDALDAAWFSLDEVALLDIPGRTVTLLRQISELR